MSRRNMMARLAAANAPQPSSTQYLRSVEAIADIADRLDQVVNAELDAEPADVDVDHVGARVERVAPDVGEQVDALADVAGMAHQVLQQQELALGEHRGPPPAVGHPSGQVQAHPAGVQPALVAL